MHEANKRCVDGSNEERVDVPSRTRRQTHLRAACRRAAIAPLVAALALASGIQAAEADEPGELAAREMLHIDSVITGDRLYFHAGPKTAAEDPQAGHARDRALAIAEELDIEATTNPGLNPDFPRGTGCCSDQVPFDEAGIPVVNLEATNWKLGDLDGYQQTEESTQFPDGYSWHLVAIDNIPHLEAARPGRVEERSRNAVEILTRLVAELAAVEP